MANAANLLSGFVFVLFLLRHTLSYALAAFPGENWLWRLSLAVGFDVLPILAVLRDQIGCGAVETFAILAALLAASYCRSPFISLAALHIAALAISFCWMVAIARYGPETFTISQLAQFVAAPNLLGVLSFCLLVVCVHSHIRVIRTLRATT